MLYFEPGAREPAVAPVNELAARFLPGLYLVAHENAPSVFDEEGGAEARFGFR